MSTPLKDGPNSIQHQLMLLVELQELDNEIIEFEEERDKIPGQLEGLEDVLHERRKKLEEVENRMVIIEDDLGEKKQSLDLERLKLKNTRNKETAIQNIKQYEAFVKEVETQEKTSDELEIELKELDQQIEELRKEKALLSEEIKQITEDQAAKRRGLEERIVELDKTLEELYDLRDEKQENIRESIYLKYEYIAERKEGLAVAEVQHGHCLACNMAIPPQMFNELIRGNQLMSCPACGRILVYIEQNNE